MCGAELLSSAWSMCHICKAVSTHPVIHMCDTCSFTHQPSLLLVLLKRQGELKHGDELLLLFESLRSSTVVVSDELTSGRGIFLLLLMMK